MELKDFIKKTVTEISSAIIELNQDKDVKFGLAINPIPDNHVEGTKYTNDGRVIQDIEFNLQVSVSEKTDIGGKLGIKVLNVGMSNGKSEETVNTIKFSLSVALPTSSW